MRFKILVIDDEPILRDSLEIALKTSGYEVTTARTGEEGLGLFEKENPKDHRPRKAIEAIRAWAQGKRKLGMKEVRKL